MKNRNRKDEHAAAARRVAAQDIARTVLEAAGSLTRRLQIELAANLCLGRKA